MALGRESIVRGYSTLFVPATGLVTQLARAHAEGRLEEKLLFPSDTQVAVFVSMDVGKLFELESVQIKLDEKGQIEGLF